MAKKPNPSLVLRVLRKVLRTPTVLGFLAVLPILTEGTSFHDAAVSMRTYGALGILNYEAFAWWATRAIGWFEAKGKDWDRDPRFLLTGLLALPFATIWSYLAMRLFEHPGEWKVIFTEVSGITVLSSVLVCGFGLSLAFLGTMARTHLSRDQHPFIADRKPPAGWRLVVILLAMPGFLLAVLLLQRLLRMFMGTG